MKGKSDKGKVISLTAAIIAVLLFFLYPIPYTLYPSQAFDIGSAYGFGDIPSLAEGVQRLVAPTFSLATTAVIIYFLIGAFKYVSSGGDKEAVNSARAMITHAMIGFAILIFAFLILQFIPAFFGLNFAIFK